jgi:hypothetical protein
VATASLPILSDKPPKSKRQRERDTLVRDLQFDDIQQDLWMIMQINEQSRALELQREALERGDIEAALTLNQQLADRNRAMAGREQEDHTRHQKRGDIAEFLRREKAWRPGDAG